MTTREEMALAFAVAAYGTAITSLTAPGVTLTPEAKVEDLSLLDEQIVREAVEMADLLLLELAKNKNPA